MDTGSRPLTTESMVLNARQERLLLRASAPLLMGVLNLNPGSFSDDRPPPGTPEEAVERGIALHDAGASIVDVGVESGVTYDDPVDDQELIDRCVPVIQGLSAAGITVSIDTARPAVVASAVAAGASIVNDVSGAADPAVLNICATSGAALVILHTRAAHKVEHFPRYEDVVADVQALFADRIAQAVAAGVRQSSLILDPGIDYAKRPHESAMVLQAYGEFLDRFGLPLLTGASRKYFAGIITGAPPSERLAETLATVGFVADWPGILRVHDVDEVRRFLAVQAVLRGARPFPEYTMQDERLKWNRPEASPASDDDG